jgi:hypothetical protein
MYKEIVEDTKGFLGLAIFGCLQDIILMKSEV